MSRGKTANAGRDSGMNETNPAVKIVTLDGAIVPVYFAGRSGLKFGIDRRPLIESCKIVIALAEDASNQELAVDVANAIIWKKPVVSMSMAHRFAREPTWLWHVQIPSFLGVENEDKAAWFAAQLIELCWPPDCGGSPFAELWTGTLEDVESPAERRLAIHLLDRCEPIGVDNLSAQYETGKYRLDFALHDWERGIRIDVEVDGHDFHDRTKEQAQRDRSRDRELTAEGWTVLRFTGREVWQNAAKCAQEAVDLYQKRQHDAELRK